MTRNTASRPKAPSENSSVRRPVAPERPSSDVVRDAARWSLSSLIGSGGVLLLFLGGWYAAWAVERDSIPKQERFQLTVESIVISEPPEWIRVDVRGEALRDASLDGALPLLDPDLCERIACAFKLHPWVADAPRVEKLSSGQVLVDLVYRRPVLMVEVPDYHLLPVDAEGTILPGDHFREEEAVKFPRLRGLDTVPVSFVGTRWGDIRVTDAAKIAAAFGDDWGRLGLHRIEATKADEGVRQYTYHLVTRGGMEIVLGELRREPEPGDRTLKEKVEWLVDFFDRRGSLDVEGLEKIDLRDFDPIGEE